MKRRHGVVLLVALAACGRNDHDASPDSPPGPSSPPATSPEAKKQTPAKPAESAPVVTTPSYAKVGASSDHTCAIVRRVGEDIDRVKCWGSNANGELGLGDRTSRSGKDMGDALPFVPLPGVTSLLSIDAESGRTCALQASGDLWCWGEGRAVDPTDAPPPSPSTVPLPGAVTAFAMGRDHACVVLKDASVRCWGGNRSGVLGSPTPAEPSAELEPVELGTDAQAVDVTAGQDHTCVLLSTGRVKCFGDGMAGQLGLTDTEPRGTRPDQMGDALPFTDLGDGFLATAISAGGLHTCALSTSHSVACWGGNRVGQLGQGHTRSPGRKPGQSPEAASTPPPTDLGTHGETTMLRAGGSHSCVLKGQGIKCWGWGTGMGDDPGEMGDALPLIDLGSDRRPVEVAAGDHSCAVVVTEAEPELGRLLCWGGSSAGATGMDVDRWHFERDGVMGDALPFVDLGKNIHVVVPG